MLQHANKTKQKRHVQQDYAMVLDGGQYSLQIINYTSKDDSLINY